ncbi:hypothetical protein NL478_26210, partial [Klebsiella pneumoniae]|nr:hypothetical protein [Klebsiella pneumoniae]
RKMGLKFVIAVVLIYGFFNMAVMEADAQSTISTSIPFVGPSTSGSCLSTYLSTSTSNIVPSGLFSETSVSTSIPQ